MGGLNGILEIARRAILASRTGMDVVSHNVSNANTPGYTRQRVELANTDSFSSGVDIVNGGVEVVSVTQIRSNFIDSEIKKTANLLGSYKITTEILDRIEALINEPSEVGLMQLMENFFNAFDDLAKNPEDKAVRTGVVQSGIALSKRFNDIFSGLLRIKSDVLVELEAKVKKINEILARLAKLNETALKLYTSGRETNDIKDKIHQSLKELSELVSVKFTEDNSGAVRVSVGGVTVVGKDFYREVKIKVENGLVKLETGVGEVKNTGGEVYALQSAFNDVIPGFMDKFDELAKNLITSVNSLHRLGYGMAKGGGTPPTGYDFFAGTGAGSIQVSKDIIEDVDKVSASINGEPGNNEVALAISRLRDSEGISQLYRSIISEIGVKSRTARDNMELHKMILNQLESQREAVSGVSLDEEMVNLIKFQKAFDAAAKVAQTVNRMFDTLLEMVS